MRAGPWTAESSISVSAQLDGSLGPSAPSFRGFRAELTRSLRRRARIIASCLGPPLARVQLSFCS